MIDVAKDRDMVRWIYFHFKVRSLAKLVKVIEGCYSLIITSMSDRKYRNRKRKWVYICMEKLYKYQGSSSSIYWTFSVAAEIVPLKAFGGFCKKVYHCEWQGIILLTEIICSILRFHVIDCQGKIYSIPTATEPGWNPRIMSSGFSNKELGSFSWFLLIPVHVIIDVLTGFAGDGDFVSQSHWQKCWRLCNYYFCPATCLGKKIGKINQKQQVWRKWQKINVLWRSNIFVEI